MKTRHINPFNDEFKHWIRLGRVCPSVHQMHEIHAFLKKHSVGKKVSFKLLPPYSELVWDEVHEFYKRYLFMCYLMYAEELGLRESVHLHLRTLEDDEWDMEGPKSKENIFDPRRYRRDDETESDTDS